MIQIRQVGLDLPSADLSKPSCPIFLAPPLTSFRSVLPLPGAWQPRGQTATRTNTAMQLPRYIREQRAEVVRMMGMELRWSGWWARRG